MESKVLRLVAHLSVLVLVVFLVVKAFEKREAAAAAARPVMPSGVEWVNGIVDGPHNVSGAVVPQSSLA